MAELVIRVTATGAQCLWTDAVDLRELGELRVSRMSQVEFDQKTQYWEAWDCTTGALIAADRSRAKVLEAEARHYAEKLGLR